MDETRENSHPTGILRSLFRYPLKGFTPEPLDQVTLGVGELFPCDRMYAIENGPSGFDAENPVHISKYKFAVLATIPRVALARTRYNDATGVLSIEAPDHKAFRGTLTEEAGRKALAQWLTSFLGTTDGPLKVLCVNGHRFLDTPIGHISAINLDSIRDLERRLGRPVDPLRFRANIYFDGWPAWSELEMQAGASLKLGEAKVQVVKCIDRCIATHVDPLSGTRDMEVLPALRRFYGHIHCGFFVQVVAGGRIAPGTKIEFAGQDQT